MLDNGCFLLLLLLLACNGLAKHILTDVDMDKLDLLICICLIDVRYLLIAICFPSPWWPINKPTELVPSYKDFDNISCNVD